MANFNKSFIKYAVYNPGNDAYVGHRTTYYNYKEELPMFMINKNYPWVTDQEAKLYTRLSDAKAMIKKLQCPLLEIVEIHCYPKSNKIGTFC